MEPDEAASRLYSVLECMRGAVHRFDGTVNKMQGDGFMALFGAPNPQEDHAVRACCAALAMRDAVARLGPTEIRIGMHTGEAVVQTISNNLSPQYEAMGIAVHIAARMEQAASSSGVILTSATLQASRGMVNVESLGSRMLKGLSQPIELFALQGIRSVAASQQFLGGQRLSEFVGRADELLTLNQALAKALNGTSTVLGVIGEPGAGKSRLFFEFIMACRRNGLSTIEARATAHGQVTPLRPILELMRSFFAIAARDSAEIARGKISWRLQSLGMVADAPLFIDLLGVRESADPPSPAVEHRQLLAAFERVAAAVGRHAPAVILFEDLHWLDEASEPFMDAIVRGLARTNVLLLVNFRPGYRRPWMDRDIYEQMFSLRSTPGQSMPWRWNCSDWTSPAPRYARRSSTGPAEIRFAEEMVRALSDQGALTGARGNCRRVEGSTVRALPSAVRGVIGFRIDRLDKRELFLEGARCSGANSPSMRRQRLSGWIFRRRARRSTACLDWRCSASRPTVSGGDLAFKHPLVQEVTYASLVVDRRRALHRRAAAALARQYARLAQRARGNDCASLARGR